MNWIRVNNRNNFLLKVIPQYHPASAKYVSFWRKEKKKIVEGYWGPDDDEIKIYDVHENSYDISTSKWRYMPPQLYFYVNYGTILHNEDGAPKTAPKKKMRPYLRDVEWEFFYNWIEARGFSGFSEDDEFTCNRAVRDYKKGSTVVLDKTCYSKNGKLKKFTEAYSYLRKLYDKPLGLPLYMNEAKNLFMLGSRGGGKSFLTAIGVVLHELIIDGAKEYNEESIKNPSTVEIFVGAALTSKSSEMLSKTRTALKEMPGTWMKDTDKEVPNPFFKDMAGSLEPNNMKNPFRHEYTVKVNGRWKTKGSGSNIKHGIYTIDNPEAAAGTRPGVMVVEEVGLLPTLLAVHASNEYCQLEGTNKFGSTIYIGTGGNMDKIVESEIVFRDPESYNFLSFNDDWENKGRIGWFLPAYYTLNQFKDDNGNTDIAAATSYLEKIRNKKLKAKNKKAIILEMMSRPIKPSEMFIRRESAFFPIEDLKDHLADIETNDILLDASWKARFSLTSDGNVEFANSSRQPIRNFPLKRDESMLGCVEIFEMPKKLNDGTIPAGRYIAGLDPVDDDGNLDPSLSLQSMFMLDTWTDRIVAEYTERTMIAADYYETARRLAIFYNAKINYEQNKKGLYGYFKNHKSLHLLTETPDIISDKDLVRVSSIGNKKYGTPNAGTKLNPWGLELILGWLVKPKFGTENHDNPDLVVPNYKHIRSIGLLKELILYDKDINTDRVSAMIMLMLYREDVYERTQSRTVKIDDISTNKFWDTHYDIKRNQLKRRRIKRAQSRKLNW